MKKFLQFLEMSAAEAGEGLGKFLHWFYADNLLSLFMAIIITAFVSKPLGIALILLSFLVFFNEFIDRLKKFYESEDDDTTEPKSQR